MDNDHSTTRADSAGDHRSDIRVPAINTDIEKHSNASSPSALDIDDANKDYEVSWEPDLETDPQSPRTMTPARKWLVTFIVAFSSFCVTCNSSIYTTIYDQVETDFHTTREVTTVGLTTFVAGLMVGPMLLAPLSEFYGRKPIYVAAFAMVFIWIIPCAVAKNVATILVTRWFDGFFASAFLSVAGGTIGDMYNKRDLSFPMMVYSGSPFIGPSLGPLIGGFINQYASWRWTFWVLLIWTGVQLCFIVFFIPETYHPVLLRQKARRIRKETDDGRYLAPIERMSRSIPMTIAWSCIRPFQLLILEPMVLNLCLLSAVLLGILYLFFGACEYSSRGPLYTIRMTDCCSSCGLRRAPRLQAVSDGTNLPWPLRGHASGYTQ